jgi:hypothetical protein
VAKLRADLLRKLTPEAQDLLKIIRKTPIKAYGIEELYPDNATFEQKLGTSALVETLIILDPPLIMEIKDGSKTMYTKPTRKFLSQHKHVST